MVEDELRTVSGLEVTTREKLTPTATSRAVLQVPKTDSVEPSGLSWCEEYGADTEEENDEGVEMHGVTKSSSKGGVVCETVGRSKWY